MLNEERLTLISQELHQNQSVSIDELAHTYSVTQMTIRRDLEKLSREDGTIKRCYGGAVIVTEVNIEENSENKKGINVEKKKKIAAEAFKKIANRDTIYLDAGTTVLELARLIVDSAFQLTILTNDLDTARLLRRSNCEVILTGGILQKSTGCLLGSLAENMLDKIKLNTAFMGATSISKDFDALTPSVEKLAMKPKVIKNAISSYLLVDDDKFYKHSTYLIYNLSDFTGIITTRRFSAAENTLLEQRGVNIINDF